MLSDRPRDAGCCCSKAGVAAWISMLAGSAGGPVVLRERFPPGEVVRGAGGGEPGRGGARAGGSLRRICGGMSRSSCI